MADYSDPDKAHQKKSVDEICLVIQGLLYDYFCWMHRIKKGEDHVTLEDNMSMIEYFLTHKCQILHSKSTMLAWLSNYKIQRFDFESSKSNLSLFRKWLNSNLPTRTLKPVL